MKKKLIIFAIFITAVLLSSCTTPAPTTIIQNFVQTTTITVSVTSPPLTVTITQLPVTLSTVTTGTFPTTTKTTHSTTTSASTIPPVTTTSSTTTPLTTSSDELQIHQDAWSSFVAQAASDLYLKYALYAHRTLAVKHPEIYLRGDSIFVEVLTTKNGFKQAYRTTDVYSQFLYGFPSGPWDVGSPFSFGDVDFTKYKLVGCQELYPTGYPFLPFLDRRLDLIATTLKTFDDRITELEKAEQLYFTQKKMGQSNLYLIYCDNERSYLCVGGSLISAKDGNNVTQLEGNPILIFNEDNVWYPLMGRDDTAKNTVLSQLVTKYATNVKEPQLSDFEKSLISSLKEITEFANTGDLTFLKIASINVGPSMGPILPENIKSEFITKLDSIFTAWCDRAFNEKMNLLSPISAHLAAIARGKPDKSGIEAMCTEYGKYTRVPGYSQSWGHLWFCSEIEYGVEHAYRAHAGHCVCQAASLGAALELAGIDHYRFQGCTASGDGHDFIYVPPFDLVISNGQIECSGTVVCPSGADAFKYIDFIEHDGKWAYLWRLMARSPCYGTLSPEETIKILDYLRSIHNDDIQSWKMVSGKFTIIPYSDVKQQLLSLQSQWQPYQLPPYGAP